MSVSIQSLGIDRLGIDERLELVDDILASLSNEAEAYSLTDTQKTELDRRLASYEQNPDDLVPLHEVMASATSRFKR
ncbi:MAG: addiction module protein [Sulfuricellaceae bacterium]